MAQIVSEKYTVSLIIVVIFIVVALIVWAVQTFGSTAPPITFPPYISPCPDFWQSVGINPDGTHICRPSNHDNSEKTSGPTSASASSNMNGLPICDEDNSVATSPYNLQMTGSLSYDKEAGIDADFLTQGPAEKCKWASKCGVFWEGLSGKPCAELRSGA